MVLKFEYEKEAMDVCQMYTIYAVENERMSNFGLVKLVIDQETFIFYIYIFDYAKNSAKIGFPMPNAKK